MVARCTNCGGTLYPPAIPGAPITCRFCGAPQFAQGPTPRPTPPAAPRAPVTRALPLVAVIVVVLGAIVFVTVVGASARRRALATPLDVAALQSVSLAVTPAAMTTATHVTLANDKSMTVPLSGSTFESISFEWDEADFSHVHEVRLQFGKSPPDVAAIAARLRAVLGPRVDASGTFWWEGAGAGFSKDDFSLSAQVDETPGSPERPHWKQQIDALWDVVRANVLGLKVPVDDDAVRDWLGRGRAPSILASIDPATDVDASGAAVRRVFPGARYKSVGEIRYRVTLDHPLLSEASLAWDNESHAELKNATFDFVAPADGEADEATLEACIQSAYGPPTSRTEMDHVNRRYMSAWSLEGSGELRVDSVDVDIDLETFVPWRGTGSPRPGWARISRAAWQKAVTVLDACGRQ